jgi:hypothetical protein
MLLRCGRSAVTAVQLISEGFIEFPVTVSRFSLCRNLTTVQASVSHPCHGRHWQLHILSCAPGRPVCSGACRLIVRPLAPCCPCSIVSRTIVLCISGQCAVLRHSSFRSPPPPPLPPNSHSPLLCAGLASQPQYSPPAASLHPPCTCSKSPHLNLSHIHSTSDRIRSYALVTGVTNNAHTGLFSVLAFVLTGLALMTRVNFAKVRTRVCLTVSCQLV